MCFSSLFYIFLLLQTVLFTNPYSQNIVIITELISEHVEISTFIIAENTRRLADKAVPMGTRNMATRCGHNSLFKPQSDIAERKINLGGGS